MNQDNIEIIENIFNDYQNKKVLTQIDLSVVRFLLLFEIYLIGKGYTNMYIAFDHLYERFPNAVNKNHELIDQCVYYMKNEGLIEFRSIGTVSISHIGINEIEGIITRSFSGTKFPNNIEIYSKIGFEDSKIIFENISKRNQFIKQIIKSLEGDFSRILSLYDLNLDLKYTQEELERIYFYLEDEGLIQTFALGGSFLATHKLRKRIEDIELNNTNMLENFGPTNSVDIDILLTDLIDQFYYLNTLSKKKIGFTLFNSSAKNFNDLRINMRNLSNSIHDENIFTNILIILERILSDINFTNIKGLGLREQGSINNLISLFETKNIKYDKKTFSNFKLIIRLRNKKTHNVGVEYMEELEKLGFSYPVLDWSDVVNTLIILISDSTKALILDLKSVDR